MKKQILFSLATCISLLTSISLPVIAETNLSESLPVLQSENITLTKNTAIIISFPNSITVDVTEKKDFPLTVFLAKAITDSQGNIIIPENSPVSIIFKPVKAGAKIIAQSLVANGKVIPIQASSSIIPSVSITHKTGHEKAEENAGVWGKIGESTLSFVNGGKPEHAEQGSMLGRTLGLVVGLSSPDKSRVVKISENTLYILSLEVNVDLSASE